jgi:nucleotide-binding universal stress UspA family protein
VTTILLPVFGDSAAEARTRAAVALARQMEGHLVALQTTPYEAYTGGKLWSAPLMMTEVVASIAKVEAETRARTEARLAQEAISWSFETTTGDFTREICARARLADVIVLPRAVRGARAGDAPPIAGDVAVHSATPVFAVPPDLESLDLAGPALIAWNGSAEAAAALRAALPFLRHAASATIVTVAEDKSADYPADAAAEYLGRHGIRVERCALTPAGSIADTLCGAFTSPGGGWMAMGAYGHSRAREFLLGGVTRGMLEQSPRPMLLAR